MGNRYIFSSESVGEGHPDKVADTISDAVLDACLAQDKFSRVACETYVKSNIVIVGGEITTKAKLDFVKIARDAIREIGYVNDDDVFHADKVFVNVLVTQQSPDIAQGVDAKKAKGKKTAKQGAGDQGLMFGYACNETPELMPAPIMFAHRLGRELTKIRKAGKVPVAAPRRQVAGVGGLRGRQAVAHLQRRHLDPARGGRLAPGDREVLHRGSDQEGAAGEDADQRRPSSSSTRPAASSSAVRRATPASPAARSSSTPTAAWAVTAAARSPARTRPRWIAAPPTWAAGSPRTSSPPAGRQVRGAVRLRHRPSGSGQRARRHVRHRRRWPTRRSSRAINKVFSFKPADIIEQLNLLRPIYSKTTNYGHFGKNDKDLTWEATNKVAALLKAI